MSPSARAVAITAFKRLLSDFLLDTEEYQELPEQLKLDALQEFQQHLDLHPDAQSDKAAIAVIKEWLSLYVLTVPSSQPHSIHLHQLRTDTS